MPDTYLGQPIYSILQGIQLEVGLYLIDLFHCIMHLCLSIEKVQLLFVSIFYVTSEVLPILASSKHGLSDRVLSDSCLSCIHCNIECME